MTRYFAIITSERVYIAQSGQTVEERPLPAVSPERPKRVRVWRKGQA